MNQQDFDSLREGDVVCNEGSGQTYVVLLGRTPSSPLVLTRTIAAYNPAEWQLVSISRSPLVGTNKGPQP